TPCRRPGPRGRPSWRSRGPALRQQALRLRSEERAGTVEALVTRAAGLALARPARGAGPYVSGTDDAVTLIERTLLSA
ncbi:hypothetical protein ACLEPN_42135, partial [Myxococcus sp. 1LA]